MTALIQIRGLRKHYPVRRGLMQQTTGKVRAVDGVDLIIEEGECVAVVGESGSGKSTLGRCVLALVEPSEGSVSFADTDLRSLSAAALRRQRRELQMVFQDPVASLNPRMSVGDVLSEPLEVHRVVPAEGRRTRVAELLRMVGMPADIERSYPHELSGGQRQRLAIARALATTPRFLVADEPVSALDVSLRGQIINLLIDLRERFQLTILLIAHDLAVVEQIADRVAVMYAGRIVELSSTEDVYRSPQHPYTVSLLSAVPGPDPRSRQNRIVLAGEPPDPADLPTGCRFHPRCPVAQDRCRTEEPELSEMEAGHEVSCHYPGELDFQQAWPAEDGTF